MIECLLLRKMLDRLLFAVSVRWIQLVNRNTFAEHLAGVWKPSVLRGP